MNLKLTVVVVLLVTLALFNFFVLIEYNKKIEQLETINEELKEIARKEIQNLEKNEILLIEKYVKEGKKLEEIKKSNNKLRRENRRLKKRKRTKNSNNQAATSKRGQMMEITAYAPLDPKAVKGWDYSGDPSVTASGRKVIPDLTAAAGPEIPFGTYILIEGLGVYRIDDRGGSIGNKNIDIAVKSKKKALSFGRQKRRVVILSNEEAKKLLK